MITVSTQDKDKDKYKDRDGDKYKDKRKNKHRVNSTLKIVRLNNNLEAFILHSNDCNDQGCNTRKTQRNFFLLPKTGVLELKITVEFNFNF